MSAAFAPQVPSSPLQSIDDASGFSVNLDSLSRKAHCSEFFADGNGQVQNDYFVTGTRRFDAQRDHYYVQDFPKMRPNRTLRFLRAGSSQPFVQSGELGLVHQSRRLRKYVE